ncbi:MAG: hypothetical protein IJW66_05400 [Clostridia bacterium]|nr:hypothetical protein [Clostridia bacterium]
MRKKGLALILFAVLAALMLFSCTPGGSADDDPDLSGVENLIFGKGTTVNIICNERETITSVLNEIQMKVYGVSGKISKMYEDTEPKAAHEIVVGKTDREISAEAYRLLDRVHKESDDEVGYLIYSDGSSLAIAYEEDRYGLLASLEKAIAVFDSLLEGKSHLAIEEGLVSAETFDALAYQEAKDEIEQAAKWEAFEKQIDLIGADGEAIASAVKDYYDNVCTDNVLSWLANLYEPYVCVCGTDECLGSELCGGGGYYFSNAARDNPGYLPDAESTSQALGQFTSSGMGESLKSAMPEWMQKQVIVFLKKLQDPATGYFYHPQWTKEEVNAHTSRRSRDMGKAISILHSLGSKPTYDAPSGDKGDGIKWDGTKITSSVTPSSALLLGRLSDHSTVSAVSKVVPTASVAIADHLSSVKAFKAYLQEFSELNKKGEKSFYAIGNTIGSMLDEIEYADEVLHEKDPDGHPLGTFGKILTDWYTDHQDKETGLWDKGVNYDATNALLKIEGTYTQFGVMFPNADLAMQSVIKMLTSKDEALTVCYVYNLWMSLDDLLANITKFAKSEADNQLVKEVRLQLLEMAPEAIRVSMQKQLQFKYPDGSFSFEAGQNCVTSQGLRVAPPGTGNGDVNATVICMSGTINNCLSALGIKDFAPGYYTKADLLRYVAILEDLDPVIKDDVGVAVEYEDFDDEIVGSVPTGIESNIKQGNVTVEERPGGGAGDLAVRFETVAKSGDNMKVHCQSGALNASCLVFETDMMIESSDKGTTILQIIMQDSVYMIALQESGGRIKLIESSSTKWSTAKETDLRTSVEYGEWFNLKIEYYVGDHDTVRIKIYFNGNLIAITDNYMDKSGEKLTGIGTPKTNVDFTSFIGQTDYNAVVWVDNVACYKTADVYKAPTLRDTLPPICIDPPDRDEVIYTFEEDGISDDFTVTENNGAVSKGQNGENGVMSIVGATISDKDVDKPASILLPINIRTGTAKCAVFEADVTIPTDKAGTALGICFSENNDGTKALVSFELELYKKDGVMYARVVDAPDGKTASAVSGTDVKVGDGFTLRLEYFEKELATLIYINDTLVAMSDTLCKYANKYTVMALTLTGAKDPEISVQLDNLIFEKNVIKFSAATDPGEGEEREPHTLQSLPEGAAVSGTTALTPDGLKLSAVGSGLTMPLNNRGTILTGTTASTLIKHVSGDGSYVFVLTDTNGKEIVAFELAVAADTVKVYEYYANGRGAELGSYELLKKEFTVSFDYYHKRDIINIKIDDQPVGVTALTYLYERDSLIPANIVIKQSEGDSVICMTNFYAENTIMLYSKQQTTTAATPKDSDTQSFEDSAYGKYPSAVTKELQSVGSDLAIKAMMNSGNTTRMLSLRTENGGNDKVAFAINDNLKVAGAAVAVLETDILLDSDPNCSAPFVQLNLRSESLNKNAWRINIYFTEGTKVKGDDYLKTTTADGVVNAYTTYSKEWVDEGTVFKLRVEYTVVDGAMLVNIFVNGTYVGTSTRCFQDNSPVAADGIDRAFFYTNGTTVGNILLDNLTFYHTNTLTEVPDVDDGSDDGTGDGGTGGDDGSGSGDNESGDNESDDNESDGNDGGGNSDENDKTEEGNPGSFDNIGAIPTVPDNAPEHDSDGWT